jgi:hypothetical protein
VSPQLQIGISTGCLTRAIQSLAPSRVPCPPAASLTADTTLLTELVITEVVPVRSDDTTLKDFANRTAKDALTLLGQNFGFSTVAQEYVLEAGKPVGDAFPAPRVFSS